MPSSLLIIDSQVTNYQTLLAEITSDVEIAIIPADVDGVRYITEKQPHTVHLVSHGSPGCLYLGNTQLNLHNITNYASQLQNWSVKNILIYGCKVGLGDAGEEFINKLFQLTGANIAASATVTGNIRKGGNWELEVTRGEIEIPLVFSQQVRENYQGVLENIIVDTLEDEDDGVSRGNVSLRDAINRANSLPGRDAIAFDPSLNGGTITFSVEQSLDITEDVEIVGLGAENLTINGNESTIFNINDGFEDERITVAIEGISIVNGYNGIFSSEELLLSDVIISNNREHGIENNASLSIDDSTIVENSSDGIDSSGTLNINNSTISQNRLKGVNSSGTININNSSIINNGYASVFTSGGIESSGIVNIENVTIGNNNGGGISFNGESLTIEQSDIISNNGDGISSTGDTIYIISSNVNNNTGQGVENKSYRPNLNIINSTLANNNEGGIFNDYSANLTLNNSTVSGNSATTGGGINNEGTATINNSTITNNSATGGEGSGIANSGDLLTIANSIVAGNQNTDIDFTGSNNTFESRGGNLIGIGNAARVFNGTGDTSGVENPNRHYS